MTHAITPATDTPWWRRLIALEPAVVKGLIGLLVALALIWGVDLTPLGDRLSQSADVLGSIIALLTPLWIRGSVTPDALVVERAARDHDLGAVVLAGPANDRLDDGVLVRPLSTPAD